MELRHPRDFIAVGEEQMGDPERIGDRQDDRVVLQESCEGDLACSSAMRTRDAIGVDRAHCPDRSRSKGGRLGVGGQERRRVSRERVRILK